MRMSLVTALMIAVTVASAASSPPSVPSSGNVATTQHFNDLLRSSSSSTGSLLPELPEDESSPTPGPDDLNPRLLRRKLGPLYDPAFTSAQPPRPETQKEEGGGAPTGGEEKRKWRGRIASVLKLHKRLSRARKSKKRQRKLILAWYRETAACPTRYAWVDMGVRYWPRYMRKGYCDPARPCLEAAGAGCRPSAEHHVTLLRFHCQGISRERRYCSWIKARIPNVLACSCTCSN